MSFWKKTFAFCKLILDISFACPYYDFQIWLPLPFSSADYSFQFLICWVCWKLETIFQCDLLSSFPPFIRKNEMVNSIDVWIISARHSNQSCAEGFCIPHHSGDLMKHEDKWRHSVMGFSLLLMCCWLKSVLLYLRCWRCWRCVD